MRLLKRLTPFLLIVAIVFFLGSCGSSLQKPSGLEDTDDNISETILAGKEDQQAEIEVDGKQAKKDELDIEEDISAQEIEKETDSKQKKEENRASVSNDNKSKDKPTSSINDHNKKSASTNSKKEEKSTVVVTDELKSKKKESKPHKDVKTEPSKKEEKPPKQVEESKQIVEPNEAKNTIVHSIVISTKTNEIPLAPTEMEIVDGDTVLQALIAITMRHKIHMDYRGGQGATAYIQGMGNVYEFDRGQGSGWMYRVNGIFPDRGAGVVPLCGGDKVEWLYTTNLGVDLGADLKPVRRDGKCP